MKKTSLLIASLCIFSIIRAQYVPFTFGPKIGINSNASDLKKKNTASLTYTNLKSQPYMGFQGGLFFRIDLPKRFYLQPEVYFAMKGGEFSYTVKPDANAPVQDASQSIKLNTVDLPILFGWRLINLKSMNLRICAGPFASYIINKSVKISEGGTDMSPISSNDVIKDVIWGAQAGAGIDILKLTLDCRYEIGLNNLSRNSPDAFKSNLFNVTVGWKIL